MTKDIKFKKNYANIVSFLIIIFVFVFLPNFVWGVTIPNPLKNNVSDLNTLLIQILDNIVEPIAAVISVVYIILAGFKYVLAKGKPAEISNANKNLMWALIGVGVLLSASAISAVLKETIGQLTDFGN